MKYLNFFLVGLERMLEIISNAFSETSFIDCLTTEDYRKLEKAVDWLRKNKGKQIEVDLSVGKRVIEIEKQITVYL